MSSDSDAMERWAADLRTAAKERKRGELTVTVTEARDLARLLRLGAAAIRQRDEAVRLLRDARPHFPSANSSVPNLTWRHDREALLAAIDKETT